MEDFIKQYDEALAQKAIFLTSTVCPKLKVLFGQIAISYESYYKILLNKGTIKPDQYSNDQQIIHPTAPSSEPHPEANRTYELSLRLSELNEQYQYLYTSFEFSITSLSLKTLKAITDILRYIQWEKITLGSDHYMSQSLALALDEIKTTPIYDRLLSDVAIQLTSLTRNALGYIRELSIYHREAYKDQIMKLYFGPIKYSSTLEESKAIELFISELRQSTARSVGFVFYRELAIEAIKQLYSTTALELQTQVLEKLQNHLSVDKVAPIDPPPTATPPKNRETLFIAFSELGRCSATIEIITTKLELNNNVYIKHGLMFAQRVLLNIRKFMGVSTHITYEINFKDDINGQNYKEKLDFTLFLEQLKKRAALLAAYTDKQSTSYKKLTLMTDSEELNNFLAQEMYATRIILLRCAGLDEYFKGNIKGVSKTKIRGLKIELSSAKYQLSRVFELRQLYSEEDRIQV